MNTINESLLGAIWALHEGALSPGACIAAAQQRAAMQEPWLKSFCHLPASHPPLTKISGALSGIPVAVKDVIATADMPTTNGSPIYAGQIPAEDAWIVAKIKEYGGTIFGKTVTTEFAWRHPGPTVNPWNRQHTPGGSSSGSAAAVAAGIVPLALGTQTVGSVIRPAAYNGVVGFKPSYGQIPRDGVHPLAGSLDHLGFFTHSVADAAAAYALFVDGAPQVVTSAATWKEYFTPLAAPRFAVMRTGAWALADAAQQANFEAMLAAFAQAGAELVTMELPEDTDEIVANTSRILQFEAAAIYGDLIVRYPDKVSDRLQQLVALGRSVSDAEYGAARGQQQRLRSALAAAIDPCDAILTVPATGVAPRGLEDTGDAVFCSAWTLMGAPAVTIPSGWSAEALPFGLQIVGPFAQDKHLLRAAAWAEKVASWEKKNVD